MSVPWTARARRLSFAAALVALAVSMPACGEDAPMPAPSPTPPPPPTATATPAATPTPSVLTQLASETAWYLFNARRLEPGDPIPVRKVVRTDAPTLIGQQLSRQGWPMIVEQERLLYAFLGLIPEDLDLGGLYLDLAAEQSPAWYPPATNEIRVVQAAEEIGVRDAMLVAFGYGFALQEAHFGLSDLLHRARSDRDRALAMEGLSTGDAVISMTLYALTRFPTVPAEEIVIAQESPMLKGAPFIVEQMFLFPFTFGVDFVVGLQGARGWSGVNATYSDPPASSTEVIHPAKFLEGFEPATVTLPDLATALGPDWRTEGEGVFGEFRLRVYLGTHLAGEDAVRAATGWAGDRYTLVTGPAGRLLGARSTWESRDDAREFFESYVGFTNARRSWDRSGLEEGAAWWSAADEYAAMATEGPDVWLVLGPDEETVGLALGALGR